MRIGLFTDTYLPQISGVSASVHLLRQELMKRGHRVYLFTTTDPQQAKDERQIIRIPSIPFVSSKRVAINYNPLLSRRVGELNLDVIHTHTEFGLGIFGRSVAKLSKIPHVHTYHTVYEEWMRRQFKAKKGSHLDHICTSYVRRHTRFFCNLAQRVIVPSIKTEVLLRGYGVHRPIDVVPTGIQLSAFTEAADDRAGCLALRERCGVHEREKVLLYLGRLSKEKCCDKLLTYLAPFLKRDQRLRFLIVGDGPHRSALEEQVRATGLGQSVQFVGAVDLQEVPKYYAMADAFVCASENETQGLTYIEAMASGLPILVYRDACLLHLIQSGQNGYFFESAEEFAEQLECLLALSEEEKTAMGKVARASAQAYSVEAFVDHIEALYQRVVKKGRD